MVRHLVEADGCRLTCQGRPKHRAGGHSSRQAEVLPIPFFDTLRSILS